MTDDPVEQALAELQDLVRCRCHPAYTGRGLRDPDCECDSAEAVKMVADCIEAQAAEIERLRAKLAKAVEAWDAVGRHDGIVLEAMGNDAAETWNALCAVLAELTGGKDD